MLRKIKKIFEKVNVVVIVEKHLQTLVNAQTKKHELGDYVTFLFIPSIVSLALIWFGFLLNKDFVGIICSILSIFVGLFFNVIVIIFDIVKREAGKKMKVEFLRELLYNISFTILISVFCIVLSLCSIIEQVYIRYVTNFATYFLAVLFLMTVLMILKRMFMLFSKEIDDLIASGGKG
jgi:hypothetical protein